MIGDSQNPLDPNLPLDKSGGVNLTSTQGDVSIIGDAVGGDKIIHNIQNNYYAAPTQASVGLQALTDLMQHSSIVREAIVTFRVEFQEASHQIDILSNYKDLHDLLHQLEFECYDVLLSASTSFPNDEDGSFVKYQIRLENIADQLHDVTKRGIVAKQDTVWIQRLATISIDLDQALKDSDQLLLDLVLRRLKQILDIQPSQINSKLNSTARALRLPVLVDTLSQVRDHLQSQSGLDPEKVRQFREGVAALLNISEVLTMLIDEHDGWQAVEVLLNRIEDMMNVDAQELEMSWTDLVAMTEPLCKHRTDKPILAFLKEAASLEESINSKNPARTRNSFFSYRTRAGNLFYRIDTDLKRLCGDLRQVGTPLAAVLRITE